jgi:hypothetical protein
MTCILWDINVGQTVNKFVEHTGDVMRFFFFFFSHLVSLTLTNKLLSVELVILMQKFGMFELENVHKLFKVTSQILTLFNIFQMV